MQRLEFKADGLAPEQLRLPEQQSRFAKGLLIGAATVLAVIYSEGRGGVALNPVALAFGSRLVGDATPVQSVLLRNTSRGPLRVNSVKVEGAGSGDFLVASDNCTGAFIESGNACVIEIRFLPQASGDRAAVLVLADDAPESPQTVRLNGTATERRDLAVIPGTLSFDAHEVGSNSIQSVQVVNKGSAAVSIASPAFSGDAQGDFEIASETCTAGALSRGQSCNMAVRFTPTTEGGRTATLRIEDRSGDEPHLVLLTGNGTVQLPPANPPAPINPTVPSPLANPELAPSANPSVPLPIAKPGIDISRATIDFGEREFGRPSDTQSLIITSTGTGPLQVDSVHIEGKSPRDFSIVGRSCSGNLHPQERCTVNILFTPTRPVFAFAAKGKRDAELLIADNASGPHRVNLTGTALRPRSIPSPTPEPPQFSVRPSELDFGKQTVGQRQSKVVTVTNIGSEVQVITSQVSSGGQNAFMLRSNSCRLDPQRSCEIYVIFMPQDGGKYRANLSLSSASGANTQAVTLVGSGLSPGRTVSINRRDVTEFVGWCCADASVSRLTRSECKGSFSIDQATAERACRIR